MRYGRPIPDRVLAQQVKLLYANALPANLTVAVITLLLTISFWEKLDRLQLVSWALIILATTARRIYLLVRYEVTPKLHHPAIWGEKYTFSTLLVGIAWGCLALLMLTTSELFVHYVIFLVIFGTIAVAVPVLAPRLPAFFAYVLPQSLLLIIVLMIQGTRWGLLLSAAALIYTGLITATSRNMSWQIRRSIELETHNQSLVDNLRKEAQQRKAIQEELETHKLHLEHQVALRTEELTHTNENLQKEIGIRIQAEDNLKHLAHHDTLTNLPNRLLFDARLEHAISRAHRNHSSLAVLFLDLDNFKNINDSMGHLAGDQLLQQVTLRLKETTREDDTIARLGGDEFVVLMEESKDTTDIIVLAQKILDRINIPFEINGETIFVGCSIGISLYPQDGENPATLLRNADAAMYRTKDEGRNSYNFYTQEMTASAYDRIILEGSLRHAIEHNELKVYYQPQKNLAKGHYAGVEALVRWDHPELGVLAPGRFLPVAEATGLIVPLGAWVLRHACLQMVEWKKSGLPIDVIAVNLAGKQIRRSDLVQTIKQTLKETGCKPEWLELEVTEGFIMTEAHDAIDTLHQLRALGIQLAIDDFGTGYSSLSYLKKLPIHRLKIDRSFVQDLAEDNDDAAIVKAIISLGASLQLTITAEGVETPFQEEFLTKLGCELGQGYLYSQPVPKEQIECLISDHNRRRSA
ncbi:putative bifunctional diguanylate cyclase/phosphodiesterase [Sedimenticola selenatireducens]|uniref:cyclic-guanylate-specific phosphodiesterase n=1 Tax=Sedimenticola selenatireducens TaxID=191960 RepID=A0A557S561_9GAMM|nr:EAL domain-containing protein [Sedimenticola selenatireducens]TVO72477.1 EAL domain-containing protein [Sedimenticola selenatireducens]TVT64732.1 MAG: EAL domain-containing protein [Sedimenticola selenatireducens]